MKDKDGNEVTNTNDEQSKSLNDLIKAQAESNIKFQESMQQSMQQFQTTVADSIKGLSDSNASKEEGNEDSDDFNLDDAALESMPRSQFMQLMTDSITKAIKKDLIDPMQSNIGKDQETRAADKFRSEIASVKKDNPDFNEWGAELKVVLQNSPTMGIKDALTLVRAKDSEKVEQLKEKFPDDESADIDDKYKSNGKSFGGMRSGNRSSEAKVSNMSKEDSSTAAWDEVMADVDLEGGSESTKV